MITVLVMDPVRLLQEGIRNLLDKEADIEVIGVADTETEAIDKVNRLKPDVVIMDIDLPAFRAINAVSTIKKTQPATRVVYLTEKNDPELLFRGVAIGADGILHKGVYPDMLGQAIRDAHRGQYIISGKVAETLVNEIRKLTLDVSVLLRRRLENKAIFLTKRELDIAILMMKGFSNQQIAKETHLSEGTIKNYISEMYMKLGMHHRKKVVQFLEDVLK